MYRSTLCLLACVVVAAAVFPAMVSAQVPQRLSYQGVLTDLDGTVVADGEYQLRFQVFNNASGNLPVMFSQQLTVSIKDGIYNVILSDSGGYVLANAFSGQPRYMEVTVMPPSANPLVVMLPRQEIASVPFALNAAKAAELTTAAPNPLPAGAIILWTDTDECPPGFAEAPEFNNLTIRGADLLQANANVPDGAGKICDGDGVMDAGCGTAGSAARYNDVLEIDELAAHHHSLIDNGNDDGDNSRVDVGGGNSGSGETINTQNTGGAKAHYHPFRTVLFCKRQ